MTVAVPAVENAAAPANISERLCRTIATAEVGRLALESASDGTLDAVAAKLLVAVLEDV